MTGNLVINKPPLLIEKPSGRRGSMAGRRSVAEKRPLSDLGADNGEFDLE
jgi:hypothetical protein